MARSLPRSSKTTSRVATDAANRAKSSPAARMSSARSSVIANGRGVASGTPCDRAPRASACSAAGGVEHAVDQREHGRPVEAAVLGVDPRRAVGEDHDVTALSNHRFALSPCSSWAPVARSSPGRRIDVLQAHAEQRRLEVLERGLVALREQRPPAGGPVGPGLRGQVAHAGPAGVPHPRPDRAQPVRDLGGGVRGAVGAEHVHPERVAAHEHDDVPLARRPGPGDGVGRAGGVLPVAGDARGREQVLVLLHRHRRALGWPRERLGVDPVFVVERPQDESCGACGLVALGGVGAVGEEEEEVGVERDAVAPPR